MSAKGMDTTWTGKVNILYDGLLPLLIGVYDTLRDNHASRCAGWFSGMPFVSNIEGHRASNC